MAEAMHMTVDQFRSKLEKASNQAAKKKKDDSAETKKELKKLLQQVKEIKEAQVARRKKSDSDATETDSAWGSEEDANRVDLCEMVRTPKGAFAAHTSGRYTNGETTEAEGCDFERTIEEDGTSDVVISLWDSDESDSDYNEGFNGVHVINMTQKSKLERKAARKRQSTRKSQKRYLWNPLQ